MKMSVADYLSQLTSDQVMTEEVEKATVQSQQKTVSTTAINFMIEQLDTGHLGQYKMNIKMKKDDPASFCLETNLINMPMDEVERLDVKLLDKEIEHPVNLYLVVESEDINKTGLRTDELADETDQSGKTTDLITKAREWAAERLADIMEARA